LLDDSQYNSGNFSRVADLFRLHSWAPYWFDYNDPSFGNIELGFPGITLLSQNLLSTAVSYGGWEYNNGNNYFHAGLTYSGIAPVFDFSLTYGGDAPVTAYDNESVPPVRNNLKFNINTYLPLNFSSGRWISGARPSIQIAYNRKYFYYNEDNRYKSGMTYIQPGILAYFYQRTAYQDLMPRWGVIANYQNVSTPFENEQLGNVWGFRSTLYLPGILRSHGLMLKLDLQKQDPQRYLFNNLIGFPRGYGAYSAIKLRRYSADYTFPLLYPDISISSLLYLKRIRLDLFTDYIFGEDMYVLHEDGYHLLTGSFQTYGMELNFDYNPLRSLAPFSTGVRANYLYNFNEINFDLIFSIDLGF